MVVKEETIGGLLVMKKKVKKGMIAKKKVKKEMIAKKKVKKEMIALVPHPRTEGMSHKVASSKQRGSNANLPCMASSHSACYQDKDRGFAQARKNISPILTNCRICAGVTSVHLREGKMLSKRAFKHHSGFQKDSGFQKAWLVH